MSHDHLVKQRIPYVPIAFQRQNTGQKQLEEGMVCFFLMICGYVSTEARKTRCQKSEVAAHTAFCQGGRA